MKSVEFEENQVADSFGASHRIRTGAVTRLFIKLGLAKDQKQANVVMTVLSIAFLLFMTYFLVSTYWPDLLNFSRSASNQHQTTFQEKLDALRNGTAPVSNQ